MTSTLGPHVVDLIIRQEVGNKRCAKCAAARSPLLGIHAAWKREKFIVH